MNTYYDSDANLVKNSGGLRIKKITKYISETQQEETSYDYKNPSNGQPSSGQLYQNTNSYSLPVDIWFLIFSNPVSYCVISARYSYSESLSSIADLNGVQTGYSYVTVTNADLSSTRFKFTNFSEYPDILDQKSFYNNTQNAVSGINFTAHFPMSSMSFARGKVLEEIQYGPTKLASNVINYSYTLSAASGNVTGIKAYIQRYVNGQPLYYLNGRFNFNTQDLLLSSKTESQNYYSFSGYTGSSSSTENYTYTSFQNNNYMVSRSHTMSSGNIEKTTYRYPFNVLSTIPSYYSYSSRPLSYMVQNNMNKPVEVLITVVRGGAEYLLSASLTRFLANGASLKPWITYRLKNSKGLLRSAYQNYSVIPGTPSETETFDQTNLEPVVQIMQYDDRGNPVLQKNPISNIYTSHLYGYDKNYEIAKVINAGSNEAFYDGLEEPATWVGALQDNTFWHSGLSSGKLANTGATAVSARAVKTLQVGPVTSRVYKLSGWVYSSNPSVNLVLELYRGSETGGPSYTGAVSTTLTGKWVFLEKLVQVPQDVTGIYIRIYNNGAAGGGSVWFDDIRVHPADAQMTTSDYEPLVGKTGEGDVMGITMSYEYDPLRRLVLERDMNRNITKSYDYHRKTFKNAAISQIFFKQGCSSNNAPSQVTYTVNSNLYSSTLSQEDADAQAMVDIQQNGQTFANNNGTCTPVYIPYASIVPTTSSSSNGQNYVTYEIRLFSDVNLTVPFVTAQRLTINYRVTTATSINNGTPTYSSQDYTTSFSSGSVKSIGQFESGCSSGGVIAVVGDGTLQQSQSEQAKTSSGSSTNLLPPGGGGNNTCITKTLILLPGTGYINAGGLIE